MAESLVNGAKTTLAADITAAATSLTIQAADAAAFPASGTYRIQVSDGTHTELMTVTGGQGTSTLTVTRASESYGGVQTAFAFAAATPTTIGQMLTLTGLQTYIPENAMLVGTQAARPAAAKAGRQYFATDAVVLSLDTGTAWIDTHLGNWPSWTPTMTQSSALTITINSAQYAKIGRSVLFEAVITFTSSGVSGNDIIMGGLPAVIQPGVVSVAQPIGIFEFNGTRRGIIVPRTSTTVAFLIDNAAALGTNPALAVSSGVYIGVSGSYMGAS